MRNRIDTTNLASLSDWTNNRAPTLLEGLSKALDVLSSELASSPGSTNLVTESRSTDTEIVRRALLSAIVAATRFIPPIELSVLHLEVSDPNRIAIEQEVAISSEDSADPNLGNNKDGFDPWMTRGNRMAAKGEGRSSFSFFFMSSSLSHLLLADSLFVLLHAFQLS